MAAARIDEARILQAALALTDEEGFAALSMRRLADRLGVQAASLYYHVPGREAVEQLIADSVATTVIDAAGGCTSAETLMRTIAETLHGALAAHPGAAVAVATRHVSAPLFEAAGPRILAGLQSDLDIGTEDALYLVQTLYVLVTGLALAEFGDAPAAPAAPPDYYQAWFETSVETFIAGLLSRFRARG